MTSESMPTVRADFFGKDKFVPFIGIVEDVNDPKQGNRVKVRCIGWHPKDKEGEGGEGNNGILLPKLWRVDMSLSVMHDHRLDSNQLGDMAFPFGGALQSKENPSTKEEKNPPPPTNTNEANVNGEPIKNANVPPQNSPATADEDSPTTKDPASNPGTPGAANSEQKESMDDPNAMPVT